MTRVQAVDRAFSLLEALGAQPSGLTELARRVDLPLSTASRLLSTLEALGAIERLDDVGMYRIGPAILKMASSIDSLTSFVALGRPELERLTDAIGEAAGLSVPAGYTMHYTDQVDSTNPVQVQNWVGTRVPLHLVSSGLVVLAHWPIEAVENFLERDLHKTTSRSVNDPNRIRERLPQVLTQGVAWTIEELEVGISSVAAPVFNSSGEVMCAVHIHGPSFRFPLSDRSDVEDMVRESAARLSELFGTT